MKAVSDFKPFATGKDANVTPQEEWEHLPAVHNGFKAGKASSAQVNKAIRQASFVAAALAQYIVEKTALSVPDDGDIPGFIAKFIEGLKKDFAGTGSSYLKTEADKRFQPVGDYQPKGDYAAADHAYSKVESDQRYLSSNTSIPPPVSLAGYATEQWVNATHPGRNEVASDTRIIKGPALRYIEGNPPASVDIPSGGFLLRHSITNGQHDMQYGFMQQLFGSNWVTIRERA